MNKRSKPQQNEEADGDARLTSLQGEVVKRIAKAVHEKRRFIRVAYPVAGAIGDLPVIELEGLSAVPINLSQGGVLVDLSGVNYELGQTFPIKVIWKYGPLIFKHEAELIRVYKDRHHFRFTKVDARSFVEFSKSFQSGILGSQSKKMGPDKTPSYVFELWQDPVGNKILFQKTSKGEVADLFFSGYRITFDHVQGLLREEENEEKQWRLKPARQEVIDEIVIYLTNIIDASARIKTLLAAITAKHFLNVTDNE